MHIVLACAACQGDPSSPLSAGTWWGVFVLIGVVVCVLAAFASLFVFWMRRAKGLERELADARVAVPVTADEPSVDEVATWRTEEPADDEVPHSLH